VEKTGGGSGYADVWYLDHFAWEYKGKKKDLAAAYRQLLTYRENLANPPILVVCDMDRFEVHTNFTGTVKDVYAFNLADLGVNAAFAACKLPPLDVLRAAFEDPERLRPNRTTAQVTEEAAGEFSKLALSLRDRGAEPHEAAHFLIRLLFCLFAEDVGLLPESVFSRLVENTRTRPLEFKKRLMDLLDQMATGGSFGPHDIDHFNGGLFDGNEALELTSADLAVLGKAAKLDWSNIEPSILGTLFERSLDPGKRSQLGAHYTSREDILLIVEPVLMAPLRREWDSVRAEAERLAASRRALIDKPPGVVTTKKERADADKILDRMLQLLQSFTDRLVSVNVLDPACGSGNFLYVALRQMLDLEKEVISFGAFNGLTGFFPRIAPEQMRGIEINEYAHELASVTVWIGYIQWMRENGFGYDRNPILRKIENIRYMDALLEIAPDGTVTAPEWPEADVIIGNPPFLGDKKMRAELGDEYVDRLRQFYEGEVPGGADLVTYWFHRARKAISEGKYKRAGLLAT
jgi:type II restriction/modification system DNA methylase subunit YeeA